MLNCGPLNYFNIPPVANYSLLFGQEASREPCCVVFQRLWCLNDNKKSYVNMMLFCFF